MTSTTEPSVQPQASVRALILLVTLLIRLGWIALAIFAVSTVLFACGVIPEALEVPVPARLVLDSAGESGGAPPRLLIVEGIATVLLGRSDPGAAIAFTVLLLLFFGCLQYGTYQVRRVVRAIGGGRPFAAEVPRSFVRLGLVLLIGWPLNSVATLMLARRVAASVAQGELALQAVLPEKDINWLIAGLFCLVLAVAFRAGRQLQADHDLTI